MRVAVIIVCTILLILLVPVTAIATFWVIRRFLQAKREHDTPIPVGDGERTGFHNLSAEGGPAVSTGELCTCACYVDLNGHKNLIITCACVRNSYFRWQAIRL